MDVSKPEGFLRRPVARALGSSRRGEAITAGTLRLRDGVIAGPPFGIGAVPDGAPSDPLDPARPGSAPSGRPSSGNALPDHALSDHASADHAPVDRALSDRASAELHGFGWLDDLAALATPAARDLAQGAVLAWLRAHPAVPDLTEGPVWTPQVTGRRVMRWTFHGGTLLPGLDRAAAAPFFAMLGAQIRYLAIHATKATGEARIEAMAGLAIGAMNLRGAGDLAPAAMEGLALAAAATLADGTLASRNAEALLDLTAMLGWVCAEAADAGLRPPEALPRIIARSNATLRALRHADGSLPRMHGSEGGLPGRLDAVLGVSGRAGAGGTGGADDGPAMGYLACRRGESSLIFDAAPPPPGRDGDAGTLGFELIIGAQPLVTACGSGARFGVEWALAGRASAAHSTLVLGGLSSARLERDGSLAPVSRACPGHVCAPGRPVTAVAGHDSLRPGALAASHDGWRESHGVTHLRELRLAEDGAALQGRDRLIVSDPQALARFAAAGDGSDAVSLHFHLHPAIGVGRSDGAIALHLPSGEVWQLLHDRRATASIAPSVHFDPAAPGPEPAHQIILHASLEDACAQALGWEIARA